MNLFLEINRLLKINLEVVGEEERGRRNIEEGKRPLGVWSSISSLGLTVSIMNPKSLLTHSMYHFLPYSFFKVNRDG